MDSLEFSIWDSSEVAGKERSEREDIRLTIHPHKLSISEEMKNDEEILCHWCWDQVKDANYHCKECSFYVHESCAILIMRWHSHHWTSINEHDDGCYNCCSCGEIVSTAATTNNNPPSYLCRECNTSIHKSCASNLPSEIKHVFHRKHPLLLLCICNSGSINSANSIVYYCSCCKFILDMKTALQRRPLCLQEPENHKHQFISLMRSEYSYPCCDACGFKFERFGSNGPFLCTICRIVVHDFCTSLLHTINILHHNHPLTHTFFFLLKEEDMPLDVDQLKCRICHTEVDKDFGGYYCKDCHFATHVGCVNWNQISRNNPFVHGQDHAIADPFKEIHEVTEDELPVEIKHFSHEHKLSRCSDEIEDKCCDGCIRPISHTFYKCIECVFFLHKACIDLPNQIKQVFHDHPLTLLPCAPYENATFICYLSSKICHGFVYSCEECNDFYADVRCASILLNFRHPGHDHTLSFTRTNSFHPYCDSCGSRDKYLFQCNECPFGLDYRCATLQSTTRYWFHEHPLVLTYHTIDDGSDAYYCDICEKERNPKHWYYYCAQCDYAGHLDCALGMYPYLLPGRLYKLSHPFFILEGSDFENRINLCSECGSLPMIPKTFSDHKLHKHSLVFTNHHLRSAVCGICQKNVLGVWFRCGKCDFDAHPECVLGDAFNVQPCEMSLSIVKRTRWGCIPCIVCDKDCRDVCLKCPKVECTFCIHFYCAVYISMS